MLITVEKKVTSVNSFEMLYVSQGRMDKGKKDTPLMEHIIFNSILFALVQTRIPSPIPENGLL